MGPIAKISVIALMAFAATNVIAAPVAVPDIAAVHNIHEVSKRQSTGGGSGEPSCPSNGCPVDPGSNPGVGGGGDGSNPGLGKRQKGSTSGNANGGSGPSYGQGHPGNKRQGAAGSGITSPNYGQGSKGYYAESSLIRPEE